MSYLLERSSRGYRVSALNGEGRIGNRVASPVLDRRERTLGFLRDIVNQHSLDEHDVSGHIQLQPRKLSVDNTPDFSQIYSYIANRVDRYNPRGLRGKVRGHLFAHLAEHEIMDRLKPGIVVAGEQETFDFFKKAANLETTKDSEGIEYAKHTYVPDGLIIDQTIDGPVILAMLEYSSHFDFYKFSNQVYGFTRARNSLGISRNTDFIIVVPGGLSDESKDKFRKDLAERSGLQQDERRHVIVQTTNFTQDEFNSYSNNVIYNYRHSPLQIGATEPLTLDEVNRESILPELQLPKPKPAGQQEKVAERGGIFEYEVVDGVKKWKAPPVELFVYVKGDTPDLAKTA